MSESDLKQRRDDLLERRRIGTTKGKIPWPIKSIKRPDVRSGAKDRAVRFIG